MPIVGNKKYPYTKVGIKKAKKHAETTGQKMVKKYKSGGRGVPPLLYFLTIFCPVSLFLPAILSLASSTLGIPDGSNRNS